MSVASKERCAVGRSSEQGGKRKEEKHEGKMGTVGDDGGV
jgi:hypothetical protein